MMAFGSILEGPSTEKLASIVEDGMGLFLQLLKDESVVVRDTTAWAIGRFVGFLFRDHFHFSKESLKSLLLAPPFYR